MKAVRTPILSFSVKLICVIALLSLNLIYTPMLAGQIRYESQSAQTDVIGADSYQLKALLAQALCSQSSFSNATAKTKAGRFHHDDKSCHAGSVCHACRMDGVFCPFPSCHQIFRLQLTAFERLAIFNEIGVAHFIFDYVAFPRAPPFGGALFV